MVYFQVSASENNNNKLWGQFFLWLCIKAANKDLCFTFCCMFLLIWWFYMSKAVNARKQPGKETRVYLSPRPGRVFDHQGWMLSTPHFAHCIWGCWNLDMDMCVHVFFFWVCVCVAWVWREEANKEIKSYKIIKKDNAVDSSQVIHISLS